MLKKNKILLPVILTFCFLLFFTNAQAASDPYGTKTTGDAAGLLGVGEDISMPLLIGRIVGVFLSFLGIVFFILVIYGGFLWMTAGGNETKVASAKKIIMNAAIGVGIVLLAYTITYFITNAVETAILAG